MHRIRAWAHSTAHGQHFGPNYEKSHNNENDAPQNDEEQQQQETQQNSKEKKPKIPLSRQIVQNLRVIFLEHNKWLNVLLVAAPVGIAVHAAGVSKYADFAVNAVAIIPLAGLLTFATESIAARTSPTLAALLNVSFGNSVELIIFIIALIKNEIRIVQASLVGSILANLLLILGMAMAAGGLKYQEQLYDSVVTQTSSSLLVLSVLSLLIPTVFHASFNDQALADDAVIKLSRGTAVILLLVYLLYLTFQLSSHAYLYEGTPQYIIDQNTEPGILQRMDSTSSSSSESTSRRSSVSSRSTGGSGGLKRRMKKKAKDKLGRRRSTRTEEAVIDEEEMTASPDGTAPLPTEAAEGSAIMVEKRERMVPPAPAGLQPTTSTSRIQTPSRSGNNNTNNANNNQSSTASTLRPPFIGRAISIRPPPVFRVESQTNQQMAARYRLRGNELRRFNSTPNMSTVDPTPRPQKAFTAPNRTAIGLFNSNGAELTQARTKEEPPIGLKTAIILLLSSTALVAICAEFMVGSIEYLVDNSPLSEAFIGLIILPIVGNAAEHVTSVVVAYRNQMDLALGVALGSSIQIALFITPLVVIIGWIADKGMSLYFTLFETVSVFVAVFISCFLCLDGKSNYLEGTLLFAAYVIIAVGAYFFPDSQNANSFTGGTATEARRLLLRDL